jgi:hypothetical protein
MFTPSRPPSARARFAALRAVPELASCSDREIWSLLRYADEVCVPAGEQVPSGEFVVLIDGTLRAGTQLLGPGTSYGWDAMWDRSTNRASATVEADARLLVMSHAQFRAVKALVGPAAARLSAPEVAEVQRVA